MELQKLINELKNYKIGTYTNIQYKSDLEPTKEFKGFNIYKIVSTVARLGCDYGTVVKNWVPSETRKPWYHNIFKNIVVKHNNQEKNYIKIYTTNNTKQTKVKYFIEGKEVEFSEIEHMIKPKTHSNDLTMYLKNIDDIIRLGKSFQGV